jgi:hypothetical protein
VCAAGCVQCSRGKKDSWAAAGPKSLAKIKSNQMGHWAEISVLKAGRQADRPCADWAISRD